MDGPHCCSLQASSRLLIVAAEVGGPHCCSLQAFSRLLIVAAEVGGPHCCSPQAFSRLLIVAAEVGGPFWVHHVLAENLDIDLQCSILLRNNFPGAGKHQGVDLYFSLVLLEDSLNFSLYQVGVLAVYPPSSLIEILS